MKRSIFVFIFLLMVASFLSAGSNFGMGIDFPGTHEWELSAYGQTASSSYDSNLGFQFFGEFFNRFSKSPSLNFDGGFGMAYLFPRGIDFPGFNGDAKVSYVPLYLLGQISTPENNNTSFYGKAKFGYNLFLVNDEYEYLIGEEDINGGLFAGLSFGIVLSSRAFIELSYETLNGSVDLDSYRDLYTWDITQSHISLMIGIRR